MKKIVFAIFVAGVLIAIVFATFSASSQMVPSTNKLKFDDRVTFTVRVFKDENKNGYCDSDESYFGLGAVAGLASEDDPLYNPFFPILRTCDANGYVTFSVLPDREYFLNGHHNIYWRWEADVVTLTPSQIDYYYELGFTFHPWSGSIVMQSSQSTMQNINR